MSLWKLMRFLRKLLNLLLEQTSLNFGNSLECMCMQQWSNLEPQPKIKRVVCIIRKGMRCACITTFSALWFALVPWLVCNACVCVCVCMCVNPLQWCVSCEIRMVVCRKWNTHLVLSRYGSTAISTWSRCFRKNVKTYNRGSCNQTLFRSVTYMSLPSILIRELGRRIAMSRDRRSCFDAVASICMIVFEWTSVLLPFDSLLFIALAGALAGAYQLCCLD